MKRAIAVLASGVILTLSAAEFAHAASVRVHRGPAGRVHVTVARGFPIHRTLPEVVVRTTTVRVAPRTYLAPAVFSPVVVTSVPRNAWQRTEVLTRGDGWTDFTFNTDKRGDRLYLEIDGSAQISFAEVVFENGETQVVDFNDRVQRSGFYSLLDFKDGRKVDHVRMVAKSDTKQSRITLSLTN